MSSEDLDRARLAAGSAGQQSVADQRSAYARLAAVWAYIAWVDRETRR